MRDNQLNRPISIKLVLKTVRTLLTSRHLFVFACPVMYPAYAKWIKSHRDLPLKLNQWNNVVVCRRNFFELLDKGLLV